MIIIKLFCNAGLSTSLLVSKMRQAAQEMGVDADIVAYGTDKAPREIKDADVALIGPQISYRKTEFQKLAASHGVPLEVIPAIDYGMVNGQKILEMALHLAPESPCATTEYVIIESKTP